MLLLLLALLRYALAPPMPAICMDTKKYFLHGHLYRIAATATRRRWR